MRCSRGGVQLHSARGHRSGWRWHLWRTAATSSVKSLADSLDAAREMVSAAKSKRERILAVIQNRRYAEPISRVRAMVRTGSLGPLTTVNSDFYLGAHFGGFRDHMEHVLLLDMAIHSFDQARFITGADPVAVYCREWNPAGSWYDHDASAVAIFEMTGGLVYTYRGSWCSEGMNTSWECDWRLVASTAAYAGADAFMARSWPRAEVSHQSWRRCCRPQWSCMGAVPAMPASSTSSCTA